MTKRPGHDNGNGNGNDYDHHEHPRSRHISPDSSLQNWVAQQAQAQAQAQVTPRTGRVTIPNDLYQSRLFAELWYGARAASERIRAIALERLYRNRPRPGGSHPDPREPAAFSS